MQLADPELLPIVRYQAKEVLLEKGVEVLLGDNTHTQVMSWQFLVASTFTGPSVHIRTQSAQSVRAETERGQQEHGGGVGQRRTDQDRPDHLLHRPESQQFSLQVQFLSVHTPTNSLHTHIQYIMHTNTKREDVSISRFPVCTWPKLFKRNVDAFF